MNISTFPVGMRGNYLAQALQLRHVPGGGSGTSYAGAEEDTR